MKNSVPWQKKWRMAYSIGDRRKRTLFRNQGSILPYLTVGLVERDVSENSGVSFNSVPLIRSALT